VNDDRELVQQMLAGEERAFVAFFETYFPRVYRFALPRLNRNEDTAKDVVQASLIKAMRKLGDYRGEAALFTWLCQICRREIADHVRTQRRHSEKVVLIEDSAEVRGLESIERQRATSHCSRRQRRAEAAGARGARPPAEPLRRGA
jgi:RNA polymerase sigma-70 factor (ECF subfamily)